MPSYKRLSHLGSLTLYILSEKDRETLTFIVGSSTLIAGDLARGLEHTGQ